MKNIQKQVAVVNILGTVGYMLLVTVWAFFAAILLALLFDASAGMGQPEVTQPPESETSGTGPVMVAASYVITGLVILVSVGIVVTLPYFIGKWGSRLLRGLMKLCRIDVTRRQLFFVKGIVVTAPLVGLLLVNLVIMPENVTFAAMYVATVILAAVSLALFFVQLLLARRFNIPVDKVW
jgi:hypothetical protein